MLKTNPNANLTIAVISAYAPNPTNILNHNANPLALKKGFTMPKTNTKETIIPIINIMILYPPTVAALITPSFCIRS